MLPRYVISSSFDKFKLEIDDEMGLIRLRAHIHSS